MLCINGRVRDLAFEEYDMEDDVLNASGSLHGHGERLGVLVDMDGGYVAFFREGRPVAVIRPRDFPVTGSSPTVLVHLSRAHFFGLWP